MKIRKKCIDKLVHTDWNIICQINNTDQMSCLICEKINSCYSQCLPLKTKQTSYNRKNKPWLTSELVHPIKSNSKMRNKVNKKVKDSKEKYFQNMLNLYRSDIKKSWTEISILLGRKKPRTSIKKISC